MDDVLRLLLAVFEGFVLGSYMDLNLNLKSEAYSKWFIVGTVMVTAGANAITNIMPYKMVMMIVGIVLLGKLIYKVPFKQLVLRMMVYYALVLTVEMTVLTIAKDVFMLPLAELQLRTTDFTLVGFLSTAFVMIITRTISHDQTSKKKAAWGYWGIIILSNVCIIVLVMGVMSFSETGQVVPKTLTTTLIACMALAILNLFHCYTYAAFKELCQKESEYALIRHATEGQYKCMMENEKSLGVVKKVRHDLNNQMIGLDYLLEKSRVEEARAYVQKISQALESAEIKYITGYPIIDSIFNQKYEMCKLYDISLNCEIGDLPVTKWNAQDICVVLGNALDNAIEATKELPREQRKITVKMYERKRYAIVQITNTYKAVKEQKKLMTRKDRHWHGIGLKSIREIVSRYDGEVCIDMDEYEFTIKIIVPVEDEKKKSL